MDVKPLLHFWWYMLARALSLYFGDFMHARVRGESRQGGFLLFIRQGVRGESFDRLLFARILFF